MPRYAPNKMPAGVKRQYFELIRTGISGSVAAQTVGVSLSCGSVWFIDAGSVRFVDTPISPRYLTQDDRIEIADGLNRGERVKSIAERIGKTYQSVYREIARNRTPDGTYQPWYAHGQAYQRRRRPKTRRLVADDGLRMAVGKKLSQRAQGGAAGHRVLARGDYAARSRLCAIAAHSAHALLAPNRPDGRWARGPSIRSAKVVSMIACWVGDVGVGGGFGGVGEK